jgi:hypothetical protein
MYKCKYFKSHELVCPVTYKAYADRDTIYNLFDENALRILDMIREWSGVGLTVNNWHWGGRRTQCGYRLPQVTVGAAKSAHKVGKAFDIVSPKLTAQQLWDVIEKNRYLLPCRIRIERTAGGKPVTWLHFDTRVDAAQTAMIYYFNA